MAAVSGDDRAAVLGGVADERDDHDGDEELREAEPLPERPERADEDGRDERGRDRGDGQGDQGAPQAPGSLGRALAGSRPVLAKIVGGRREVEQEQCRRDRERQQVEAVAGRVAVPARHRWDEEEADRDDQHGDLEAERAPVDHAAAAVDDRDAEHDQRGRDDRAGDRRRGRRSAARPGSRRCR